jgi:hypothetical protein
VSRAHLHHADLPIQGRTLHCRRFPHCSCTLCLIKAQCGELNGSRELHGSRELIGSRETYLTHCLAPHQPRTQASKYLPCPGLIRLLQTPTGRFRRYLVMSRAWRQRSERDRYTPAGHLNLHAAKCLSAADALINPDDWSRARVKLA